MLPNTSRCRNKYHFSGEFPISIEKSNEKVRLQRYCASHDHYQSNSHARASPARTRQGESPAAERKRHPCSPDVGSSRRLRGNWLASTACTANNVRVMNWGEVELEPEVDDWFDTLGQDDKETAAFYVDLLAARGVLLDEPYTRQLRGKLRELRFHLARQAVRISYWIASDRRIILLTVFRKQRMRESAEIRRAWRAMQRCIAEAHTAGEE